MRATDGISRMSLPRGAARAWPIEQALSASIILALLLGMFLVARRMGGALEGALPPLQLVTAAVLLLAWALAARAIVRRPWATWVIAGTLLLFAIACSFPCERAVDWLVWLSVFGAFVASQEVVAELPARRSAPAIEAINTGRMLQQLTRSRTADGQDVIQGSLLAEFAPGERSAILYVAFCPPFERLPQVELESSADARLMQTLHNGVQIEVRLPRVAKTAASATVEIYATDAE
jgi:hypothetical protein